MTAATTGELSRITPTTPCCRRAEVITALRFAGAVYHQDGQVRIEVDLPTLPVARRVGATIRDLYGYPTRLQALPTPGFAAATRHQLRMTTPADAAALARRTGLVDPRGRLIRGLPAPLVAGGMCDAAAIWRGAFLVAGTLTEGSPVSRTPVRVPQPGDRDGPDRYRPPPGITTKSKPNRDTVTRRRGVYSPNLSTWSRSIAGSSPGPSSIPLMNSR